MDRNDRNSQDRRNDEMMVIFGVFNFEGQHGPEAFLGRAINGLPGMSIRPSHDSPIDIDYGYQAVSMAIRPEWTRIYARAITDTAYIKAILAALRQQLEMILTTPKVANPPMMNAARILPVLDFQWNIKGGHMTVNSTWGAGLRDAQGHLTTGTPIFAHKDDPITTAGFHLVEIDIAPSMGYLFARPCRNKRLLETAIDNLSDQLGRIVQAGLAEPAADQSAEA